MPYHFSNPPMRATAKAVGWSLSLTCLSIAAASCAPPSCPNGTVRNNDLCQWPRGSGNAAGTAAATANGTMTLGVSMTGAFAGNPGVPFAGNPGAPSGAAGTLPGQATPGVGLPLSAAGIGAGPSSLAGASSASQSAVLMQEPCTFEGKQRCAVSGVGKRQLCSGGLWVDDAACAAGETCSDASGTAVCQPLVALCNGKGGQRVCDAQGTLLACNMDGTAQMLDSCMNAMLCTAGLATGACASCVPGSSKCMGKDLLTCGPDGQFGAMTDCLSPTLCQESFGACMPPACQAGEVTCQGDTLMQWNADLTGFGSPKQCSPGLCDQAGKRCRSCMPGQRRCLGDLAQMCDAQGQNFAVTSCGLSTPHCTGEGMCVQCTSSQHCQGGACETANCNAGTCMRTPVARGSKCTVGSGYCDGNKTCLACIEDSHCSAKQRCMSSRCTTVAGLSWTGFPYSVTLRAGYSMNVSFNWGGTQAPNRVGLSGGINCSSSPGGSTSCRVSAVNTDREFDVTTTGEFFKKACTTGAGEGNSVTLRLEDINDGTPDSMDCGNPDITLTAS